MPPVKKTVAWVAICASCVTGFEGVRTVAYRDPVGIPTICIGETLGVKMGDTASAQECDMRLAQRLMDDFGPGVDRCIHHALPAARKAAYASFAYNAGIGAFCSSSMARKENAGDVQGACDALLLWNKAHGVALPGLTTRREAERKLCLS